MPLIAAVLFRKAGSEEIYDWRRSVGLILGFAGVAALVGLDLGASDPLATAEVGVVALCWATGPYLVSHQLRTAPTMGVTLASLALATVLLAPAAALWPPYPISSSTIVAVLVLGVVSTGLALLLFFSLVREAGPSRTTIVQYVNPLVAVLLGVAVLDEPFTAGIALGMPLVLVGSILATARPRQSAAGPGA